MSEQRRTHESAGKKTSILMGSHQQLATNIVESDVIAIVNEAAEKGHAIAEIPCYTVDPWLPGSDDSLEPFGVPIKNIDLIINLVRGGNDDLSKIPGSELVIPKNRIIEPV